MPFLKSPAASEASPVTAGRPAAEQMIEAGRDGFARAYVGGVRGARRLARASGLIAALDRHRDRRFPLFVRSLFAVHDIDELDRLDLPWWTFGAIERVDAFLRKRKGAVRAFEWGAGASTLWLSRRCREVVSVEHDASWWPPLSLRLAAVPNVRASLVAPVIAGRMPACPSGRAGWSGLDFASYVCAIRDAGGRFDLIVIDGRARAACLDEAVHHLAPSGLIVFDNTHRRRYEAAIARSGLRAERIGGFAPAVPWPSQTALLSRT